MGVKELRRYEVSIWSMYDDFITIIENSDSKSKGGIQQPILILNTDGTQTFNFTVPMYFNVNGKKYINPSWYNFNNKELLVNTKKIKVILNKKTDEEEIYEFAIEKITQRHSNDELYCDVECTGLAFYELGKIGYKISLSSNTFYEDDLNWFNQTEDSQGNILVPNQPIANIQYWLNQFLVPYSSQHGGASNDIENDYSIQLDNNTVITLNEEPDEKYKGVWYYAIQMNWDSFPNPSVFNKNVHRIYEEQYYDGDTVNIVEKARMVDLEESNIYNLTQNIAEIFTVYCKYVYTHDEDYKIIGRTIVFYNNFLDENELSITYKSHTQSISKEIDSADLVTKMYVRSTDDDENTTIIDAEQNDMCEDYLLDFDYLYSINNMNEEAYEYLDTYKEKIKDLNIKLRTLSERIISIQNQIPEVRAKKDTAESAMQLDQENINNSNNLLNALTGGTGELQVTDSNPDYCVLLKQEGAGDNYYYARISKKGVKANTIKAYRSLQSGATPGNRLAEQINTFIPVYDEYNNVIQIKNIYCDEQLVRKVCYLTYTYQPSLYYDNITKVWIQRLNKDRDEAEEAALKLTSLESTLQQLLEQQADLLQEKKEENDYFSRIAGTAIREGYWQPENYNDYGSRFTCSYNLSSLKTVGNTNYDTCLWDSDLFDGEQDISYKVGINETITYYPCINLTSIWNQIRYNLDRLSFMFYDTNSSSNYEYTKLRTLPFGSEAMLVFIKNNSDNIFPALLLTGTKAFTNDSITYMMTEGNGRIGILYTTISGNEIIYNISPSINVTPSMWVNLNNTYEVVYPRIRIESMYMKDDSNSLSLKYNNTSIEKYTDYYLTTRADESEHIEYTENADTIRPLVNSYYITLKPETIIRGGAKTILEILFTVSNAASSIYNDAREILKENSKPRVSYTLAIDIFKDKFIKQPSHYLSRIIRINDYELKFENIRGYVSGVTLNLDKPWEDQIEIKNYKTKYEDLFATIVAQTEEMKRTAYIANSFSSAFNSDGSLREDMLQSVFNRVDLNYAFNNGRLTINEVNGIWGISDSGVVAFRGGGIFTATQKDNSNNWVWNTGITPEGINANLLTGGQVDTNKVNIFAGDNIRFQLNGEGLFGYKSFLHDFDIFYDEDYDGTNVSRQSIINRINSNGGIDEAQFVRFNENGLFLIAKEGALVLNESKNDYIVITRTYEDENHITRSRLDSEDELKRVAITWDGLTLKNLRGEQVFFADADTGDLKIKGSVFADAFYVITEENDNEISYDIATFINNTSLVELQNRLKNNYDIGARIKAYINVAAGALGGQYIKALNDANQQYTTGIFYPNNPHIGDIFYNTSNGNTYVYMANINGTPRWEQWQVASNNASMKLDSNKGTIDFNSSGAIKFNSSSTISFATLNTTTPTLTSSVLTIGSTGITLGTSKNVTINGGEISITSQGKLSLSSGGTFTAVGSSFWLGAVNYATFSAYSAATQKTLSFIHGYLGNDNKYHLELGSDNLRILSNGSLTLESGGSITINNDGNANGKITLMNGNNTALELSKDGITMISSATLKIDTANFKLRPDLTFSNTNDSYNNVFFYVGDTFNANNTSPSHFIKYSYAKGLQIKTTNFFLDPTATGTNTVWSIGNTSSANNSYIKYVGNGSLDIHGMLTIGGTNNSNGKIIMRNSSNNVTGEWNNNFLSIINNNSQLILNGEILLYERGSLRGGIQLGDLLNKYDILMRYYDISGPARYIGIDYQGSIVFNSSYITVCNTDTGDYHLGVTGDFNGLYFINGICAGFTYDISGGGDIFSDPVDPIVPESPELDL